MPSQSIIYSSEAESSTFESNNVAYCVATMENMVTNISNKLSTANTTPSAPVQKEITSLAEDLIAALMYYNRQLKIKVEELQRTARRLPSLECYADFELLEAVKYWRRALPPFEQPALSTTRSLFTRFHRTFTNLVYTPFLHAQRSSSSTQVPHSLRNDTISALQVPFHTIHTSTTTLIASTAYLDNLPTKLRLRLSSAMHRLHAADVSIKLRFYRLHVGLEKLTEETRMAAKKLGRQKMLERMESFKENGLKSGLPMSTTQKGERASESEVWERAGNMLVAVDQSSASRKCVIDEAGLPTALPQQDKQAAHHDDPFSTSPSPPHGCMNHLAVIDKTVSAEDQDQETQTRPETIEAVEQHILTVATAAVDVHDFARWTPATAQLTKSASVENEMGRRHRAGRGWRRENTL